jgi:hypothetical protein
MNAIQAQTANPVHHNSVSIIRILRLKPERPVRELRRRMTLPSARRRPVRLDPDQQADRIEDYAGN